MLVLALRTDKPEAEIYLLDGAKQIAEIKWQAHRELSDTILIKIKEILNKSSKQLEDIQGVIAFQGPGSFTGLRIGITVANTLAYSLQVPIIGAISDGWITNGVDALVAGSDDKVVVPEYGSEPNVSTRK